MKMAQGKRVPNAERRSILARFADGESASRIAESLDLSAYAVARIVRAETGYTKQKLPRKAHQMARIVPVPPESVALLEAGGGWISPEHAERILEAIRVRDAAIRRLSKRVESATADLHKQADALVAQVVSEESRANQLQKELDKLKGRK